jgi:hypothetical protein
MHSTPSWGHRWACARVNCPGCRGTGWTDCARRSPSWT